MLALQQSRPALEVCIDNDCWYAHVPDEDGIVVRGDEGPEEFLIDALSALGLRAGGV